MTAAARPTLRGGAAQRPPRAVVGSQISRDEEMFGAAFDGRVVRRFFAYVHPYRKRIHFALVAVLIFTATQLSVPLIVRHAIDEALVAGHGGEALLGLAAAAFAAAIVVNYAANWAQDWLVGLTSRDHR